MLFVFSADPSSVTSSCSRVPKRFRNLVEKDRGHILWLAEPVGTGTPIVFCSVCARHGSATSHRKLDKRCPGGPTAISYVSYKRKLARGEHPTRRRVYLEKPVRLNNITVEVVESLNCARLSRGSAAPARPSRNTAPVQEVVDDAIGLESMDVA